MPQSGVVLVVLVSVIQAIVVCWFPFFPSQDGPTHLHNADILNRYNSPDGKLAREYYTINTRPDPNWVVHGALACSMRVVSWRMAERMLLCLYVIGLPMGLWFLLRHVRPGSEVLAAMGLPLTLNYPLHMGFYGFCLGLAAFVWSIGLWFSCRGKFTPGRTAILSLAWVGVYFLHPVPAVMGILVVGGYALGGVLESWPGGCMANDATDRPTNACRTLMWTIIAALPVSFLILLYMRGHTGGGGEDVDVTLRWVKLRALLSLYSYDLHEIWISRGVVCLFGVLAAIGAWYTAKGGMRWSAERTTLVVLLGCTACYFVVPDMLGGGWFISDRLMVIVFLLATVWLGSVKSLGRHAVRVAQVGGVLLAVGQLVVLAGNYAVLNEYLCEYVSVGKAIKSNTTLLPLTFSHLSGDSDGTLVSRRVSPFVHAASYIGLERQVLDFGNYEGTVGVFPLVFRPQRDPYTRIGENGGLELQPPRVKFEDYHNRTGGNVDYVLIWGLRDSQTNLSDTAHITEQLNRNYTLVQRTWPKQMGSLYVRVGL